LEQLAEFKHIIKRRTKKPTGGPLVVANERGQNPIVILVVELARDRSTPAK